MNTQREQLIQTWLQATLQTDQFEINFLAGDASFRRYARIKLQNKTYMLMDAPPEKEDCVPFVEIDEFFDKNGVRVPHRPQAHGPAVPARHRLVDGPVPARFGWRRGRCACPPPWWARRRPR